MCRSVAAVLATAMIFICIAEGAKGRAQTPAFTEVRPVASSKPAVPERPAPVPVKDNDLQLHPVPPASSNATPVAGPQAAAAPSTTSPAVSVELIGPEAANVGLPIAYELVVRNLGHSPIVQVHVDQELPAGFRCLASEPRGESTGDHLMWNIGQLDAGAERHIKVTVQPTGEGELRTKANVTFSSACALVTKVTRPKLSIGISGPEMALVGEPVTFQIRLSNTGTGPIGKVMLRDKLPAGLQHPGGNQIEADVGALAAGETRTISLKTTAVRPGKMQNEIVAYADGTQAGSVQLAGGPPPRNADLEATAKAEIRVVEPGLKIHLSGPKACFVKCEALFTIEVTNSGTAPSKNLRIVNHLPEGMDFVAASDDGAFDAISRTVTWALIGQEPNAQRVLTLKTRGTVLADSTNMVEAQAEGNLNARAELPVKVEGIPALALEVTDPDDPGPVGTDFLYEIRVLNQGSCPCTGIQIIAQMPEGMELREATAPVPYKVVGQQVQFSPLPKLATKADLIYRLKVRSSKDGDVRFRVQLTCDQLQQPVMKEEASRFYKP